VKNCQHMNFLLMNLIEQSAALDEQFTNDGIVRLWDYSSPFR